jgi:hypothetical protein
LLERAGEVILVNNLNYQILKLGMYQNQKGVEKGKIFHIECKVIAFFGRGGESKSHKKCLNQVFKNYSEHLGRSKFRSFLKRLRILM